MKKKILFATVATLSVVAGGTLSASAAPVTSQNSTKATIGFNTHQTPDGGTNGTLDLLYAPTAWDFGTSNTPSNSIQTYNQVNNANSSFLVIRDNTGAATGGATVGSWTLKASANQLTSTTSPGEKLSTASKYKMNLTGKGYTDSANESAPTDLNTTGALPTGTTVTSTAASPLSLPTDGSSVTIASRNQVSTGVEYPTVELTDIQLEVPGGAAEGGHTYAGTITWDLVSAP